MFDTWGEWWADLWLKWTDFNVWQARNCSRGYHSLVYNWIDAHHALTHCRHCPYQGKDESWGE